MFFAVVGGQVEKICRMEAKAKSDFIKAMVYPNSKMNHTVLVVRKAVGFLTVAIQKMQFQQFEFAGVTVSLAAAVGSAKGRTDAANKGQEC